MLCCQYFARSSYSHQKQQYDFPFRLIYLFIVLYLFHMGTSSHLRSTAQAFIFCLLLKLYVNKSKLDLLIILNLVPLNYAIILGFFCESKIIITGKS